MERSRTSDRASAPPTDHESAEKLTALVIIAHGSRHDEANADVHWLASTIVNQAAYPIVEPAFLELAFPGIAQAAEACVTKGARRVVLVPYFLSAGVHVQRDLVHACQELEEQFPEIEFSLAAPLGRHPMLVQVALERAREAEEKFSAG